MPCAGRRTLTLTEPDVTVTPVAKTLHEDRYSTLTTHRLSRRAISIVNQADCR